MQCETIGGKTSKKEQKSSVPFVGACEWHDADPIISSVSFNIGSAANKAERGDKMEKKPDRARTKYVLLMKEFRGQGVQIRGSFRG